MVRTHELRSYGVAMMVLCGALGAYLRFEHGSPNAARVLWGLAGLWLLCALARPGLLRPLHRVWMIATWPLRWLVSHLALGLVYFGVVTPIGWLMRFRGHDPLRLGPHDPRETTLWIEVKPDDGSERSFQQF